MTTKENGGDGRESVATTGRGREPDVLSGSVHGVSWRVTREGDQVTLMVGSRPIHVAPDGIGSFVTHEMFGRWRDLRELAEAILKYHPGYSPLARRRSV